MCPCGREFRDGHPFWSFCERLWKDWVVWADGSPVKLKDWRCSEETEEHFPSLTYTAQPATAITTESTSATTTTKNTNHGGNTSSSSSNITTTTSGNAGDNSNNNNSSSNNTKDEDEDDSDDEMKNKDALAPIQWPSRMTPHIGQMIPTSRPGGPASRTHFLKESRLCPPPSTRVPDPAHKLNTNRIGQPGL